MEMGVCWWAIGVGFGTVDFLFLVGNSMLCGAESTIRGIGLIYEFDLWIR